MKKFYLFIMFFFVALVFANATDQNFYIYLCFGQSNMEGQGPIEEQDRNVDERFRVMATVDFPDHGRVKGQWYTATPPLCRNWTRIGPADYFGRRMVKELPDSIRVGVIVVAIGGCDIALFEKDNYERYTATADDWMKSVIEEYGGNPYRRLVEAATLAQKEGVIRGVLLHQGETNTGQENWPDRVKRVYENLLYDLSLKAEDTPLLVGEVMSTSDACCAAHNAVISEVPSVIPNSYVISSEGLLSQDEAHFSTAGYRELGERYAEQMLKILKTSK